MPSTPGACLNERALLRGHRLHIAISGAVCRHPGLIDASSTKATTLGELGNQCCHDLAELITVLRRAKERLRRKRAVIQACFLQAGYHV
jgi:hypothetical protein